MLTISATDLPHFMQCNGSRLLQAPFVTQSEDTTIRDEGTAAHYVAQMLFDSRITMDGLLNQKAPNGVFITSEMMQHVSDYIDELLIRHDYQEVGIMEIETSHRLENTYQINGRADHILYYADTRTLHINDFKYGYRIVEPEMNWTLISHAIGFVRTRLPDWPFSIVFTIVQPRAPHNDGPVRSWEITGSQLAMLADQLDRTLAAPRDELQTGPNCGKCPALAICPAAHAMRMNALDTATIAFEDGIDNERLSYELDLLNHALKVIEDGLSARKELAQHRLKAGAVIKNYGMKQDYGNTAWNSGLTLEMLQVLTGKQLSEPAKICTPAEAKRRGVSEDVVKSLTYRPMKGVQIVRMDHEKQAKKAFGARVK